MRICKKCKIEKKLSEFYIHPLGKDGHLYICKECIKERTRKFGHSEKGREYDHKRNQTKKRKKWLIEYSKKQRDKFKTKYKAKQRLNNAVRDGRIKRDLCIKCGSKIVEGHHPDYSKPLEVIWLCPKHHRAIHKQFQRKKNTNKIKNKN